MRGLQYREWMQTLLYYTTAADGNVHILNHDIWHTVNRVLVNIFVGKQQQNVIGVYSNAVIEKRIARKHEL